MKVSSYLNFDGCCAEAFAHYARCFGTEIEMTMLWQDTPMKDQAPVEMQGKVAHVRMRVGPTILMGSDVPPSRFQAMAGAVVSVEVSGPEEAARVFGALSEGGEVQMPLQSTFWSEAFGMLRDRFGTSWMVDCEREG